MKYRDIILLYESPYIETREVVIGLIYPVMIFFTIFLLGYAFALTSIVNYHSVNLVIPVTISLLVLTMSTFLLKMKLCKEKNDLYYWRIPAQFYITGVTLLMQYMCFVIIYQEMKQSFTIILLAYILGGLIIFLLVIIFVRKKVYSLDNQSKIASFVTVGVLPGLLGLMTSRLDFSNILVKGLIPLYFLSMIFMQVSIISIISYFYIRKISRKEILYARLEKNIKALEASKRK